MSLLTRDVFAVLVPALRTGGTLEENSADMAKDILFDNIYLLSAEGLGTSAWKCTSTPSWALGLDLPVPFYYRDNPILPSILYLNEKRMITLRLPLDSLYADATVK